MAAPAPNPAPATGSLVHPSAPHHSTASLPHHSTVSLPYQTKVPSTLLATIWESAVDHFNDKLTEDPAKRIALSGGVRSQFSIGDLIDTANDVKRRSQADKSRSRQKFDNILNWFRQYGKVVDVMIQHQPEITALVWGSIRLLLTIAVQEQEISDQITDAVCLILKQISRCEEYLALYSASEGFRTTVTELFAWIINFLVRTRIHYDRKPAVRVAKAALTPSGFKFGDIFDRVKQLADETDREAAVEHQKESVACRTDIRNIALIQASEVSLTTTHREVLQGILNNLVHRQEDLDWKIQKTNDLLQDDARRRINMARECHEKEQTQLALKWLQIPIEANAVVDFETGTCKWVLNSHEFREWSNQKFKGLFWIHGIPGCGKTVLARYIAENAFRSDEVPGGTFTYFFQQSAQPGSGALPKMVTSLLAQTLRAPLADGRPPEPHVLSLLMPLVNFYTTSADCPVRKLWDAFQSALESLSDFLLVVDGLDECEPAYARDTLLGNIRKLAILPQARIVVLSRHFASFDSLLGTPTTLCMDPSQCNRDIEIFLEAELERTPQLQPFREQIVGKTLKRANGMFLWATLMMNHIKRATNTSSLVRRLEHFPTGLNEVYQHFIDKTTQQLDASQLELRRQLFMLLSGCLRTITIPGISRATAINVMTRSLCQRHLLLNPLKVVEELCSPLATSDGYHVQLVHASAKDYLLRRPSGCNTASRLSTGFALRFDREQLDVYMSEKTLAQLLLPQYAELKLLASFVRVNVGADDPGTLPPKDEFEFYDYACLHWHIHVSATINPSENLLRMVADFLTSRQFVAWGERLFFLKEGIDSGPAMEVKSTLDSWLALLPPTKREQVPLDAYVSCPYTTVINDFDDSEGYKLEASLLSSRLGDYYNWICDLEDAFHFLSAAAYGLVEYLGRRNPLTLRALSALANSLFSQGLLHEAAESFREVGELQREVLGENHKDTYVSLSGEGLSFFYLTQFREARTILERATSGLFDTTGPTGKEYLYGRIYLGYALEQLHRIPEAFGVFETTWLTFMTMSGSDNPATTMVQCALGVACRKMRMFADAQKHMSQSFVSRQRIFGLDKFITFDNALNLAYLFRDQRRLDEASAYVDLLSGLKLLDTDFERYCQYHRMRALLQYDTGRVAEARDQLQHLLATAKHHKPSVNRELLWVRLTMADMLRELNETGDLPKLFQDLAQHVRRDGSEETVTEDDLIFVEEALRLIRRGAVLEAESLFQERNLAWKRPDDFNLCIGGPEVDTAWIGG